MIFPYNSNNFGAYKPLIYSCSTVYRLEEKTGGPGGCPPGNTSVPPYSRDFASQ
jgi:hypothetical protein